MAAHQMAILPDTYCQLQRSSNGSRLQLLPNSIVKIENLSGDIQIFLSRRSDLELNAKRRKAGGSTISPEEITMEQKREQVSITTQPTRNSGGLDLKVFLPEGTHLRLVSELGNIDINGAVGSVVAKTQNGNVRLNLPDNMNVDVALTSVTGTVRTTRAIKPTGDLDSKSMYGQLGSGGNVLVAHSKNGQVTLSTNRGEMASAQTSNRSFLSPPDLSALDQQPMIIVPRDRGRIIIQGGNIQGGNPFQQSQSPGFQSLAPETPAVSDQQPQDPSSKQQQAGPALKRQSPPPKASKPQFRKPEQARPEQDKTEQDKTELASNTTPKDSKLDKNSKPDKNSKSDMDDDNVLRIESQLVTLNTIVSNSSGQPILDLQKDDFQIYEDKIPQEVAHFQTVKSPFNLVLLIDLSGSVKDKINLIKRTANRFVQAIRPEDRIGIVTFSGSTRIVSPLTSDRDALQQRIETIDRPLGGTNFYDALEETMKMIESSVTGERNAIVIMSDGVDNALPGVPGQGSRISFNELFDRVQESDNVIFPIYLDTEEDAFQSLGSMMTVAYDIARKQLQELADSTGGTLFFAKRVEDLEGRYEEVAAALRTIYSLGYYPSNSEKDGSYRRIQVQVKRDGAKIKSRRGYYAKKD
jgi:VWFA-related protein